METIHCYDCEQEIIYSDDDVYTSCDIIEGQYTEVDAVTCPHCELENRLW